MTDRYYHKDGSSCSDGNCGRAHALGFGALKPKTHASLASVPAQLAEQLRASYPPREPMLSYMPFGPGEAPAAPAGLSEADIRRIAEAVCDEQERRASHPLRVTAADVRRWVSR